MRIVIEIDGDNVAVHTDRAPSTDRSLSDPETASIVDAGPAPAELLRDFAGAVEPTAKADERTGKVQPRRGKRGSVTAEGEPSLNPLRAGEAVARQRLGQLARQESEPAETIDAGRAPSLSEISRKEKAAKRTVRKK